MKVKSEGEVAQLCPTLSNPIDCSPPGSSVHGSFQARVLEWGAIAFSTGSSRESKFSMESVVNSTDSNELQGTQYFLWVMYCDSNFDVQFDLNAKWLFRIDCLIWILLCTVIVVISNASFPSGQLVI